MPDGERGLNTTSPYSKIDALLLKIINTDIQLAVQLFDSIKQTKSIPTELHIYNFAKRHPVDACRVGYFNHLNYQSIKNTIEELVNDENYQKIADWLISLVYKTGSGDTRPFIASIFDTIQKNSEHDEKIMSSVFKQIVDKLEAQKARWFIEYMCDSIYLRKNYENKLHEKWYDPTLLFLLFASKFEKMLQGDEQIKDKKKYAQQLAERGLVCHSVYSRSSDSAVDTIFSGVNNKAKAFPVTYGKPYIQHQKR